MIEFQSNDKPSLQERLRQCQFADDGLMNACADRIDQLERELAEAREDAANARKAANSWKDELTHRFATLTPDQFAIALKAIRTNMGGHTINLLDAAAWDSFLALLERTTAYSCGFGPMPPDGNRATAPETLAQQSELLVQIRPLDR